MNSDAEIHKILVNDFCFMQTVIGDLRDCLVEILHEISRGGHFRPTRVGPLHSPVGVENVISTSHTDAPAGIQIKQIYKQINK